MTTTDSEASASTTKLAALLFVSGGCALVFQVVWIRELRLIFGATTLASSAVLAIFMGGLGLGNALLGKRIDRFRRPVRFYAILEAAIAATVAISPFLIDLTRSLYVSIGGQFAMGIEVATIFRLVASTAVLIVPTFFMGGTLPAAACAVTNASDTNRKNLASIYGFNTIGAVAGAGLANFVLVEWLGNRVLLWSACLVNVLLAVAAFRYSQSLNRNSLQRDSQQDLTEAVPPESTRSHTFPVPLLYFAAAIVGFVFFQMEIVWYRMLGPLLGGTTYTFGLILCIVLLGIGVGGWLYSLFGRWAKPRPDILIGTCTLEALCLSVPFWYGDQIAMWVQRQQMQGATSFGDQVWHWFQVGAVTILPVAVVSGFQFPVLIALAGSGQRDVGRHVGWIFAANTIGAICGSIAGGFFLLPAITAIGLWRFSVAILIVLGVIISLYTKPWKTSKFGVAVASMFAILAGVGVLDSGPSAAWRHSGIGAGRSTMEGTGPNAEQEFINTKRRQLLWEGEGVESSIGITATDSLAFIVNGKSDGNAYSDAGTQIGLGLLGPLLGHEFRTGLVIGLGTGESAGWLVDSMTEQVDIVELESVINIMAERCAPMNRQVLQNPRIQIHYNDAREFLLTSKSEYDVIVSEPSNPYRAGIANLYTQEFYQSSHARLSKNGLFLQWLQGYEVDDQTVRVVLKTIRSVFPQVEVWRTKSRDMVLVCGKSPDAFSYNAQTIKAKLSHPVISEGIRLAWRTQDVAGVLAHYVCDQETINAFIEGREVVVNTDNRNVLEYAFAKTLGQVSRFSIQDFQQLAIQLNDIQPQTADPSLSKLTSRRRLAMFFHLGGAMPPIEHLAEAERPLAQAYSAYLEKDYATSAALFEKLRIDHNCPIETAVYAHGCAESGRKIPEDLLQRIEQNNQAEHAAISSISLFMSNQQPAGVESLLKTFELLRSNPWGLESLYDSLLRHAVAAATLDQKEANLIFEGLGEPFAMYRLEDKRKLIRYLVSENLEDEKIAIALAEFEPNVPWKEWLLKKRVAVYRKLKHDLLQKAEVDLKNFRDWERP